MSEENGVVDRTMDLSQRSDANVQELSYHPEDSDKSWSKSRNDAEQSVSSSMALSDLSRGLDPTRLSTIVSVTEGELFAVDHRVGPWSPLAARVPRHRIQPVVTPMQPVGGAL